MYKIKDLKASGLPKESWIDISKLFKMPLSDISIDKVGHLSKKDIDGLSIMISDFVTRKKVKEIDQEQRSAYLNYLHSQGLDR